MPTQKEIDKNIDRLYKLAKDNVDKIWGSPRAILGPVLYRGLLAEELLRICAAQDDRITPETLRQVLTTFYNRLVRQER